MKINTGAIKSPSRGGASGSMGFAALHPSYACYVYLRASTIARFHAAAGIADSATVNKGDGCGTCNNFGGKDGRQINTSGSSCRGCCGDHTIHNSWRDSNGSRSARGGDSVCTRVALSRITSFLNAKPNLCFQVIKFSHCRRRSSAGGVVTILRNRYRRQNPDDRHDDHQLDQGKTLLCTFHGYSPWKFILPCLLDQTHWGVWRV